MNYRYFLIFPFIVGIIVGYFVFRFKNAKYESFEETEIKKKDSMPITMSSDTNQLTNDFLGLYSYYTSHFTASKYGEKNRSKIYADTYDCFQICSIYKKGNKFYAFFIYQDEAHTVTCRGRLVRKTPLGSAGQENIKWFEIEGEYVYIKFDHALNAKFSTSQCPQLSIIQYCKFRPTFNSMGGCTHEIILNRIDNDCYRYGKNRELK